MIHVGDVRVVLPTLPAESVHCVVTSPPFYQLRDYGVDGQIGLEESPDAYIEQLTAVFREVRRVLRSDGTAFVEIGDSYAANRTYQVPDSKHLDVGNNGAMRVPAGLKPKDLMLIPFRLAAALQGDGWWLRQIIVWSRPNPMPESVQGSHYSRHQVTMEEYERLSRLSDTKQRPDPDGTGDLPVVQAREVSDGQATLSAERKGASYSTSTRGTRGRAGEAPPVQPVGSRETEPGEVRSDAEGVSHQDKGTGEVSEQRTWQTEGGATSPAHQGHAGADSPETTRQSEIRPLAQGQSQKSPILRDAQSSNRAGAASDGRRLVGDSTAAQEPLSLLWEAESADAGPRDSGQQGGATRQGEHRSSLQELQLDQEQQVDPSTLVDCPGCPTCFPHGGYILHMSAGRCTTSHSYVLLLAKSSSYYYDAVAVAERSIDPESHQGFHRSIATDALENSGDEGYDGHRTRIGLKRMKTSGQAYPTRNRRSVWTIPTQPFSGAHFAVFPEKLVEPCVLAGTSERGCCRVCGAPWVRVVERSYVKAGGGSYGGRTRTADPRDARDNHAGAEALNVVTHTTGWRASCTCPDAGEPVPATVLDPFFGSGTVGAVAERLGRRWVGVELSEAYADLARKRTAQRGLFTWDGAEVAG